MVRREPAAHAPMVLYRDACPVRCRDRGHGSPSFAYLHAHSGCPPEMSEPNPVGISRPGHRESQDTSTIRLIWIVLLFISSLPVTFTCRPTNFLARSWSSSW